MAKDYYAVLGIDKKASKDDIKKAFRKLAHKYHPDKGGGDESKFKEVTEAYAVLADEKRRREYDTYGQSFPGGAGAQGNPFAGFDFSQFGGFGGQGNVEFDFGDMFEGFGDLFGQRSRSARTRRGRDISIDIEVSFKEAILGAKRSVLIAKVGQCDTCHGSGAKPGTEQSACATCNGTGKVHETRNSMFGQFTSVRTCNVCDGLGKIPKEKCTACGGRGVLRREEEVQLTIPAGIDNGEMIRLPQQGEAVKGGTAGDLYIKVHVKSHPVFRKDGMNLVMQLPVKLTDALLGSKVTIETVEGKTLEVTVPPLTKMEETLRVAGRGVRGEAGKGDLLIQVSVILPRKLSGKARRAIEDLQSEGL